MSARVLPVSLAASLLLAITVVATGCGPVDHTPEVCGVDDYQGNDSEQTAADLGELHDDPDSGFSLSATLTPGSSVDWYRVHVSDTGLGGDPNISVTVPYGFRVSTWFVCDGGHHTATHECLNGTPEQSTVQGLPGCAGDTGYVPDENGDSTYSSDPVARSTTDCSGTSDDDGTLYIRVDQLPSSTSCSYDLTVQVD
ncbi:MAG: hypothetical protein JWP97_3660 [Labilithrix sp.]|nr:hypothetical protein [Labilithrix sp.]